MLLPIPKYLIYWLVTDAVANALSIVFYFMIYLPQQVRIVKSYSSTAVRCIQVLSGLTKIACVVLVLHVWSPSPTSKVGTRLKSMMGCGTIGACAFFFISLNVSSLEYFRWSRWVIGYGITYLRTWWTFRPVSQFARGSSPGWAS